MNGRSSVLDGFLNKYIDTHKDLRYAYCDVSKSVRRNGTKVLIYYDSDGNCLGDADTREKYMGLLRKTKCALYSTPGMDERKFTNGFNQVTPRFLELLASGCHVIARYPDNPDTQWYHLNDFCKSVETYEEFEAQMDYARTHDIDREKYKNYLAQHCTSKRAEQLQEILATL